MKSKKGFTKLDNDLLFSNELGIYSKIVLMGLTYFTRNGTGKCFCKKSTLASYLNLTLYQVRRGLVELEEKDFINIKRVGQGNPDIITLKGTLKNLKSRNEKPQTPIHYREEELVKEELEEDDDELSIPNINNITPKDDNPPPGSHQVGTPDKDLDPETPELSPDSILQSTPAPPDHHQHQQSTRAIRNQIRPQIGYNSYLHFFSNISVVNETHDTISLYSPHGNHIANLIKEKYSTKLANILGKDVKIITS